jgi:hypothetical protein
MTNPPDPASVAIIKCCGCGKPWELGEYKVCDCPTNCGFDPNNRAALSRVAKPRCAWCNAVPTAHNLDGDDLCVECCHKWVRNEGLDAQTKHRFWGAGEPDCPRDIKASNGELWKLRCKVCGQDSPRDDRCLGSAALQSKETK